MKKNLYFLDEQEKNRILNLHESHTKKQYLLSEQQWWDDIRYSTVGKGIEGFALGGALGAIKKMMSDIPNRATFSKDMRAVCTSNKIGPAVNSNQLDTISANLKKAIETQNILGQGYATKASAEQIKNELSKISSVPDICGVIKRYGENYGADLLTKLNNEFYNDNAWNNSVRLPLMAAMRKTEQLSKKEAEKPAETLVGWENYPCVTTNPNAKKVALKDGSVAYDLIGMYFYGNGRKMNQETKQMSSYHCAPDNTIREGEKTQEKAQQPITNYQKVAGGYVGNAFSGNVVKQLRDSVGITGEGGLGQNDINQLYAKISALPNKQ